MAQIPANDPAFMESINMKMRVPGHLHVGPGHRWDQEECVRKRPPAHTMHIPERLTYTEAPDMSPTPLFTVSKPACGPIGLEPCWENASGETFNKEGLQSPMRRSYSDQSFCRTPPASPTQLKQALAVPRHQSSFCGSAHTPQQHCDPFTTDPLAPAQRLPVPPLSILSPLFMLQAAKELGQQASQCLLQTYRYSNQEKPPAAPVMTQVLVSAPLDHNKKSPIENWSPEEEGGAAVEFIILRRQVMKISRRLAALERHSAEHRNTELILFSLLISACLLNAWLWIRR